MKKSVILTLAALAAIVTTVEVDAQEKGKFWIGGEFGFESAKRTNAVGNEFSIAPEFGYNFSDRWGAGIAIGVQNGTLKSADYADGITRRHGTSTLSIAPFARYTFLRWRKVQLYADGGVVYSYSYGMFDDSGNYSDAEVQYGGLLVNPGFAIHLGRCFALTGGVNLLRVGKSSIKGSNNVKTWEASLNSPFTSGAMTLGFQVSF